jgi:hypothetical protein
MSESTVVVDHCFYLWDDTDDVTRTLCGVGCGYGPEDHISPEAWAARERLRDAAPLLLEALEMALAQTGGWIGAAQDAIRAARPADPEPVP